MDPLSALGATIACVQVADRLGSLLAKAKHVYDAPKEVEALVIIVAEWKALLQNLQYTSVELGAVTDSQGLENLTSLVLEAKKVVLELEKLLAYDLERSTSIAEKSIIKVRRLKWARTRSKGDKLKQRLLDLRNKITSQLVLISM